MPARFTPRFWYLLATASWFLAHGLHVVTYSWLVTMELRASPALVGLAQMVFLLPGTVLMLLGGGIADRYGGRNVALVAQLASLLAPVLLLVLLTRDALSYPAMLLYAVLLGTAMAFLTPARDSLLSDVSAGRVQRTVMLVSIVQFGMQIVGSLLAAFIDVAGPIPIILLQASLLLVGALTYLFLPLADRSGGVVTGLLRGLLEGARTVLAAPGLRVIVLQNFAMAILFMGSFIVLFPLLVRETFGGQASDLSLVNAINSLGLVLMILYLLRLGDLRRQGLALIVSQLLGSVVLFAAAAMPTLPLFIAAVFVWGLCGGVAMTMSRTIMQEQAPATMRGRVMSFYGFSFMGAGPLGALLCGFLARWLGPAVAIMVAAASMFVVVAAVAALSALPRVVSTELTLTDAAAAPEGPT